MRARGRESLRPQVREVMVIAERGRTTARRTHPGGLGKNARSARDQVYKRTGIDSDTDLMEVALANIAVADDYADWLLSRRGAVGCEIDLEF